MPTAQPTKRDQIVDELRRMILTGALSRGEKLPQDELARQFNASITPVREAMRLLEAEGLLVAEPHRGVRVAGVDLDRVKGSYVVRRLTESYAMKRAVDRMAPRDIAAAEELIARMRDHAARGDSVSVRELNRQFHFSFYERCGLPALCDEIAGMWRSFPWDLMLSTDARWDESQREHQAIVDAVRAGDGAKAAELTEAHIRNGYLAIADQMAGESTSDPFDLNVD
ncbi:GntR family transcriptional regulator [Nocardia grenadensis]